jgi:superfamily I DNA and/or RNA helicase
MNKKIEQVVLCTNAGAAHRDVETAGVFDVCVIDEAAMALEVLNPHPSTLNAQP